MIFPEIYICFLVCLVYMLPLLSCGQKRNFHIFQSEHIFQIIFNMDDSKLIYTYKNLLAYFSINGRFCLVSLGNLTFSNIFSRARHVLLTFESWTLCARLCIFSLHISHFSPVISASIHCLWTILISKSWWWLLKPKR